MISLWWVIAAFFGGGFAGILVMALMYRSGGLPDQSAQRADLNGLRW
jgi:RsiW-degrading membrane proteinase PrsW (M82 family)